MILKHSNLPNSGLYSATELRIGANKSQDETQLVRGVSGVLLKKSKYLEFAESIYFGFCKIQIFVFY